MNCTVFTPEINRRVRTGDLKWKRCDLGVFTSGPRETRLKYERSVECASIHGNQLASGNMFGGSIFAALICKWITINVNISRAIRGDTFESSTVDRVGTKVCWKTFRTRSPTHDGGGLIVPYRVAKIIAIGRIKAPRMGNYSDRNGKIRRLLRRKLRTMGSLGVFGLLSSWLFHQVAQSFLS